MYSMVIIVSNTVLFIWKLLDLKILITRKKLQLCTVTDIDYTYCGDHFTMCTNTNCTFWYTLRTNTVSKISYTSIFFQMKFHVQDWLPRWLRGKESACNAGDTGDAGSTPGSGRPPRGGGGNPNCLLQYSCWENRMDRGAWQATVPRAAERWTQPSVSDATEQQQLVQDVAASQLADWIMLLPSMQIIYNWASVSHPSSWMLLHR